MPDRPSNKQNERNCVRVVRSRSWRETREFRFLVNLYWNDNLESKVIYWRTICKFKYPVGGMHDARLCVLCRPRTLFVILRHSVYDISIHPMALQPKSGLDLLLWGYLHTELDTRQNSSGRVISLSQRPLPTQDNTTYIWCIHPSNGATAQIGPWPPLLRFHNNNVLRCEVVSLTTNPH
jgi:hypothetical protein